MPPASLKNKTAAWETTHAAVLVLSQARLEHHQSDSFLRTNSSTKSTVPSMPNTDESTHK